MKRKIIEISHKLIFQTNRGHKSNKEIKESNKNKVN